MPRYRLLGFSRQIVSLYSSSDWFNDSQVREDSFLVLVSLSISIFVGPAERYRQEGEHVPKCLTQSESREIYLGTLSLLSEGKL